MTDQNGGPVPHDHAHCPGCGREIGTIYVVDGRAYLNVGTMMIRSGVYNCPVCGARARPFHWHGESYDERYRRKD